MIVCSKCKAEGRYYYDGFFIRCKICSYEEWAKEEADGHITHLWDKWQSEGIE